MVVDFYRNSVNHVTVTVTDNCYCNRTLMGDNTLTLEFYSTAAVDLQAGDRVTLFDDNYFIKDAVIPVRDVSRLKYTLTLYSSEHELSKAVFFISDSTGADTVSVTSWFCTPAEFLAQLVVNMNRVQPSIWAAGSCLTAPAKTLELNDNNCYEVIQAAATLFETSFWVNFYTVNFDKIEFVPTPKQKFEVAKNKGLRDITANKSADSDIITRLYAFGSDLNNLLGQRLSIPAVNQPGALEFVEAVKVFEDIYPKIERTVLQIQHLNREYLKCDPIGFALADYLMPGVNPTILFKSGDLMGLECEIYDWQYDYLFCIRPYNYLNSPPEGPVPGANGMVYHVGDKFVIQGITMPPAYVAAAELELYNAAVAFLAKNSVPKIKLNVVTDDIYFGKNNKSIQIGETINIKSDIIPQMLAGIDVNVIGYKQYLSQPWRYESLVVGDIYFKRKFNTVIREVRNTIIFKNANANGGNDSYFRHVQATSSLTWTVNHNLKKRPSVSITDLACRKIEGRVDYINNNTLIISFSVAQAGYAELN